MDKQREVIYLHEAQARLNQLSFEPKTVSVSLHDALNETLAKNISAPFPLPNFRRAEYDGYGISDVTDLDSSAQYEIVGEIGAGDRFTRDIGLNETVKLMTGCRVPDEIVKVIPIEKVTVYEDKRIQVNENETKANITEIGYEVEQGQVILKAGTQLTAAKLSLAAAFGIKRIKVYQKISVGILTTGSELIDIKSTTKEGTTFDSNQILLTLLVKESGGQVVMCYTVSDDLDEIDRRIVEMSHQCDLILTSGGVSVGDYDYIAAIAQREKLLFNKIAMRPGSCTTAFCYKHVPVIGLSGNPGACFTGFYFLAEPMIQKFRKQASSLVYKKMTLAQSIPQKNTFERYLRATHSYGRVQPLAKNQSSALQASAETTCFIKIPANTHCTKEMEVDVWLLPCR